ncbi:PREDICTED: protein-L-isoaspartate O-methyltransferase 1 isoform X2 [Populus euphratica]|uniref:Protein-L-isoaspartate O-methyltransferase n=1 Tax=Populus euphratica TaxID=75702 RepID=A0AAJ6X4N6_POPEU|nr:PREDICTED: protein-L-isoaspartate O-methyltransferase 1 isoform X2 [Populus euphratica]
MPRPLLLMPISLSLPAGVIAYGCRNYSPPLKRLLADNYNDTALLRYLYHRSSCNNIPSQLTSLFCFKFFPTNLNCLLTGNSLFFRMERFWSGSSINKNKAMVEHLQHYGVISSKKVSEVMETIDRALFVPDGTPAYVDSPMAIGYNATISAPHMHATCLQLLEENLKPGMHALDVGSGTGYLTACLALMVGPQGRAVGVEHIPELANSSLKNIEKSAAAPLLKEGSLSIHVGDGREGWPEFAPYDAIHVGAAAPEIPQPLLDQLKPGGRMVIPVGNIFQDLKVVDKKEDGSISVRSETSVRYVPLTSRDAQLRGY